MKTKKTFITIILSVIIIITFINISVIQNGNSNLSLSLSSLQKAMADGEGGGESKVSYCYWELKPGEELITKIWDGTCLDRDGTKFDQEDTCVPQ